VPDPPPEGPAEQPQPQHADDRADEAGGDAAAAFSAAAQAMRGGNSDATLGQELLSRTRRPAAPPGVPHPLTAHQNTKKLVYLSCGIAKTPTYSRNASFLPNL